ncbi:hypothetical protein H6G17_31615 [Chroococcidiopsis sp. FACHB-1243]|uniref:hypothetical protein n=1 Tax=Chroococcidiopsis sp. [FACHB-1243] TaxID=2692781 RepID=UPI001780721F|nr:hypothetical protein [Chroococcidiopsis sp. [FACHB-1243]]MBD2309951.1 hypothetical protein [Chroococcidiopsis sp. [FACHB-1243]]
MKRQQNDNKTTWSLNGFSFFQVARPRPSFSDIRKCIPDDFLARLASLFNASSFDRAGEGSSSLIVDQSKLDDLS